MASITVGTPFNIDLEFKIAAFGKRLLAWFVDFVIICFYFIAVLRYLSPLLGVADQVTSLAGISVVTLPALFYQLLMEILMNGQTLGKKVTGIKVVDREGREPTWGQYTIRWILCTGNLAICSIPYTILRAPVLVIFSVIVYLPDVLSLLIAAKRQRLGDLAAGTVVIDSNYRASIHETIYLEIEDKHYQPVFPQVMRLSDRDINGIRNLLKMKTGTRETDHYIIDVSQKIKKVLGIESDLYPLDFLEQLLLDYNYYTANPKQ